MAPERDEPGPRLRSPSACEVLPPSGYTERTRRGRSPGLTPKMDCYQPSGSTAPSILMRSVERWEGSTRTVSKWDGLRRVSACYAIRVFCSTCLGSRALVRGRRLPHTSLLSWTITSRAFVLRSFPSVETEQLWFHVQPVLRADNRNIRTRYQRLEAAFQQTRGSRPCLKESRAVRASSGRHHPRGILPVAFDDAQLLCIHFWKAPGGHTSRASNGRSSRANATFSIRTC